MLMMGLKVLGLWESGRCVLLWSGNSTKALGARTGSPCHKQYYRVGMGQQWGFGDGREIKMPDTIDHFKAPPHHPLLAQSQNPLTAHPFRFGKIIPQTPTLTQTPC